MILVVGASRWSGQAVLPALAGRPLRALVSSEYDAVRLRDQGIEAIAGDVLTGPGLHGAMRGVETLVYVDHAMDAGGDPVANELEAVQNTLIAARAARVKRVIFLGDVAAAEHAASRQLVARWAAELAVRQSELGWVVLRVPLVIGGGATLFEALRRSVDRMPVVPLFRWRRTEAEPVALGDLVEAVRIAVDEPEISERSFDVCGADRVRLGEVVRGWGRAGGKRRLYLPLPGWGERFGEQLGWTLERLPRRETRLVLETMRERQVCVDPSRRFPLPHRPLGYRAALGAVVGR
jgi:uncharacterized protein YbjT (DUF2867 family)